MKTYPNDPASPCGGITAGPDGYPIQLKAAGLTKREHFAGLQDGFHEEAPPQYASAITGIPAPDTKPGAADYSAKWSSFWTQANAIYKVMQADALIAALNRE